MTHDRARETRGLRNGHGDAAYKKEPKVNEAL